MTVRGPFPTLGGVLAGLSAAGILALTLHPADGTHDLGVHALCLACGEYGVANIFRNILLFVPLGLGLGLALRPGLMAWLPAPLLSAAIELAQLVVPGRNTLLIDWVANSAGGAVGIVLAAWGCVRIGRRSATSSSGPRPRTPSPSVLPLGICLLLAAATLVGSMAAFRIALPAPPHFIQWTPALGHYDTYGGEILEATLGGQPVPGGRHPDPAQLEALLLAGAPLEVEFEAGAPPAGLAPIFNIFTGTRRELLVLGARRDALAVRLPFQAARWRLDRPELRLPGAMAGVDPGRRVVLEFRMAEDGVCLQVTPGSGTEPGPPLAGDGAPVRSTCGLRPTPADGWSLLLFPGPLSHGVLQAMGVLWLVGLGLLPGFFSPRLRWAAAAGGGLALLALAAPSWTGSYGWTPVSDAGILGAASLVGYALAETVRRRTVSGARPTNVAAPPHDERH